jgi:hypothetical protein
MIRSPVSSEPEALGSGLVYEVEDLMQEELESEKLMKVLKSIATRFPVFVCTILSAKSPRHWGDHWP